MRPPHLAQHIGEKSDVVLPIDPLRYRLRSFDSHLVMFVDNPTDTPVKLRGDDSVVVDPKGQSHPLQSLTIAAASSVKRIFPPIRPRLERTGPSIGIGVGGVYGRRWHRDGGFGYSEFEDDYPRYYAVYGDETYYWDWQGESEVRMSLVFQREKVSFTHEFTFRRKKM